MARRQEQKEMINTNSVTRVPFPCSSESNSSDLPCVAAKNISAVQFKIFSKCAWQLPMETFDTNNAAFAKPF